MEKEILQFIYESLNQRTPLPYENPEELLDVNYVEEGLVDSLGLLQFILEIEDEFQIEFTEEEMLDVTIMNIQQLINTIQIKREKIGGEKG